MKGIFRKNNNNTLQEPETQKPKRRSLFGRKNDDDQSSSKIGNFRARLRRKKTKRQLILDEAALAKDEEEVKMTKEQLEIEQRRREKADKRNKYRKKMGTTSRAQLLAVQQASSLQLPDLAPESPRHDDEALKILQKQKAVRKKKGFLARFRRVQAQKPEPLPELESMSLHVQDEKTLEVSVEEQEAADEVPELAEKEQIQIRTQPKKKPSRVAALAAAFDIPDDDVPPKGRPNKPRASAPARSLANDLGQSLESKKPSHKKRPSRLAGLTAQFEQKAEEPQPVRREKRDFKKGPRKSEALIQRMKLVEDALNGVAEEDDENITHEERQEIIQRKKDALYGKVVDTPEEHIQQKLEITMKRKQFKGFADKIDEARMMKSGDIDFSNTLPSQIESPDDEEFVLRSGESISPTSSIPRNSEAVDELASPISPVSPVKRPSRKVDIRASSHMMHLQAILGQVFEAQDDEKKEKSDFLEMEEVLDFILFNSPDAVDFNFSNHPFFQQYQPGTYERRVLSQQFAETLSLNHYLTTLILAAAHLDDHFVIALTDYMKAGCLLQVEMLNLETNFVTGKGLTAIAEVLELGFGDPDSEDYDGFDESRQSSLIALQLDNQIDKFSSQSEDAFQRAMRKNTKLLKVSIHLRNLDAQKRVERYIIRNVDLIRLERLEETDRDATDVEKRIERIVTNTEEEYGDDLFFEVIEDWEFIRLPLEDKLVFADGMEFNTHLESLRLVGLELSDRFALALGKALRHNTALVDLDMDRNRLTSKGIREIVRILKENSVLMFISLKDQEKGIVISPSHEQEISQIVKRNTTLLSLKIDWRTGAVENRVFRYLHRNEREQQPDNDETED